MGTRPERLLTVLGLLSSGAPDGHGKASDIILTPDAPLIGEAGAL